MPGWGTAVGWLFDQFGTKAERRRNAIAKLEERQRAIEKDFRNDLVTEYARNEHKLRQLRKEAESS